MKIINNSTNPLLHGKYSLKKGEKKEIPDEIAKSWLTISGVEKYIEPKDLEKAQKQAENKAKAEIEALKKECDKLKDENKNLKAEIEARKAGVIAVSDEDNACTTALKKAETKDNTKQTKSEAPLN